MELRGLNSAVAWVHTWQVYLRLEADLGCLHGVVGTAPNGSEENTIVELGIGWPNDSTIPFSESSVVTYAHKSFMLSLTLAKTV